jgi:Ni/Fe-hydrogenase subunit HybB-like protein
MNDPRTAPVIKPGHTSKTITEELSSLVLRKKPPPNWYLLLGMAGLLVLVFMGALAYLLLAGVGIWGLNVPVAWGLAIINMVWWAGIAHAGTLISAVLLIMRQEWRTSVSRMAEAMTLFAAAIGGLFPLLHLGRIWLFYYIIPYPNTMGLWPQFRSPLVWDVIAILAHTILPFLFFYLALIPDLATLRDRTRNRRRRMIYNLFSLGWRGSIRHWHHYDAAYFLLAALFIPLVISLHSIISYTFAITLVPGWHISMFPPYFLAGAILSGFAMILTLAILLRAYYRLDDYITLLHLDNSAKIILGAAIFVGFGYLLELFFAWYSGNIFEMHVYIDRMTGVYAPIFWAFIALTVLLPQVFWFRWARANIPLLLIISILINVGMWLKRFMIVVTSLSQDYLPSSWGVYTPTIWDWALLVGTLGLFIGMLLLFIRFLPVISIHEMREMVEEKETG